MIESSVPQIASEFRITIEEAQQAAEFVLGDVAANTETLDSNQAAEVRGFLYQSQNPHMHHSTGSSAPAQDFFRRLKLENWRQFDEIDLDLSSRLTIITGENGTGKTSLLAILGQAFQEHTQFIGTPSRDEGGFFFLHGRKKQAQLGAFEQFGEMTFSSSKKAQVGVRAWNAPDQPAFAPELFPSRSIPGMYLDAQRVIGPYQKVESIPPRFNSASEIANDYRQQLKNLFIPHSMIKSPSLLIKEALIAAALYGEGNSVIVQDPRAKQVWDGFQEALTRLFPASLGFTGLRVDQGELIIVTHSGQFALEASSGGVAALVSLCWQIYLKSVETPDGMTVCFDEPENHLHPSLQRSIIPALLDAFPTMRFVVATHSPFVVNSSRQATIYALRRRANGRVYADRLDIEDRAYSAEQILSDVLGVNTMIPVWAERQLQEILTEFRGARPDRETVETLFERLHEAGLDLSLPDVSGALSDSVESDAPDARD